MKEALRTEIDDGSGGCFPQSVPVARIEGKTIITEEGYDCPLSRDVCFQQAEKRGLGQRKYHVLGRDAVTEAQLVSIQSHLGTIRNEKFMDLITKTLYFSFFKMPWDSQKTSFSYMEAVDQLEGSTIPICQHELVLDLLYIRSAGGHKKILSFFRHVSGALYIIQFPFEFSPLDMILTRISKTIMT
jgi:hypothetical protein